jgi:hypothetical protein
VLALPGDEELDVVTADVGHENLHSSRANALLIYGGPLIFREIENFYCCHGADQVLSTPGLVQSQYACGHAPLQLAT